MSIQIQPTTTTPTTRTASTVWEPASSVPRTITIVITLVQHSLRMQWRAIAVWGLSLGALSALIVGIYPSIGAQMGEILEQYPEELLSFMGSSSSAATIEGFLALEIFNLMAPLLLASYASILGGRALAGAEERGTLDVLLSNPVSRRQLVLSSFLTIVLALCGVVVILGGTIWITAVIAGVDLGFGSLAAGSVNLLPLCLFFGGMALFISSIVHRGMPAIAIPIAIMVVMYVVDALANISDAVEPFRVVSVFHYYGSAIENGIDWFNALGITVLGTVFMMFASLAFDRRDLYT